MKLIFLLAFFLVTFFGIAAYLAPNDLSGCATGPDGSIPCQPADAIIAISGGDTAARAEEAIGLYQNGWAPKLVFSGAAQDQTGPSNAAVMRDAALKAGVPNEDILIGEHSRTTRENADETKALLRETAVSSVIVVTSPYHQRRADLEFERAFEGADVRSYPVRNDKQWSRWWWTTPRGWYLTIGELAKISVLYMERLG